VSGNGELVAFASFARDLVTNNIAVDLMTNDIGGRLNVFVHDLLANTNILVSVDRNGTATNASYSPVISADGRYVAFASGSANLVTGDNNLAVDIFRRDLQAGTTARVSLILSAGAGTIGSDYDASFPAISQDGRYVAFICRTNTSTALTALFWCDMNSNLTLAVSGSVSNQAFMMSAIGKRVAYFGTGARLYVWDANSATNIYTNSTAGLTSAAFSPAGNRLLYLAAGGLYVYDLVGKTNLFICLGAAPIKGSCPWSGDGRYVAFVTGTNLVAGDNNGTSDVYLLDYQTGNIVLVSKDQTGAASAAGVSDSPALSEDGRFVAFRSFATNALPGVVAAPSLILYDRLGATHTLLSTGPQDTGWTTWVSQPVFSTDASRVAFQSWDAGLVSGDLNGAGDVLAGDLSGWPALDSDGNGIPDWWRIEYFGHATGQAGDFSRAQDDADGDGMNNLKEFLAGTVPADPFSVLTLHGVLDATRTNVVLNWTAASGKSYQILSATNLNNAPWIAVPASVQAAAIGGQRVFSVPATNSPGFFRLQTGN
jgi:Tol biopolymer transport system component